LRVRRLNPSVVLSSAELAIVILAEIIGIIPETTRKKSRSDPEPPKFDPKPPKFDPEPPKSDPEPPKSDPKPPKFDPEPPKFGPETPKVVPETPKVGRRDDTTVPGVVGSLPGRFISDSRTIATSFRVNSYVVPEPWAVDGKEVARLPRNVVRDSPVTGAALMDIGRCSASLSTAHDRFRTRYTVFGARR
jgi:hypothetical protein